jgi:hypothetical protein
MIETDSILFPASFLLSYFYSSFFILHSIHSFYLLSILFSVTSRPVVSPTQPPVHWVPETVYSGVKRHGLKANHSPPSNAEEVMKRLRMVELYLHSPIRLHGFVN